MTFLRQLLALSGVGIATAFISAAPASALTMSECSAKYNSAKEAGTLGGQTWNEFRKAACGAGAAVTAEPAQKPAKAATGSSEPAKGLTMQECSAKYNQAKQAGTLAGQTWNQFRSSQCSAAAMGGAATETDAEPAKGLTMKECSTKYNQAKQAGTLGGQTWNQFRASQCSAAAVQSGAAAKTTAAAATGKGLTMKQCSVKYGRGQGCRNAGRPDLEPIPQGAVRSSRSRGRHRTLCRPSQVHGRSGSPDHRCPARGEVSARRRPQICRTKSPARHACTPAWINITPTRTATRSAVCAGSRRAVAITACAMPS